MDAVNVLFVTLDQLRGDCLSAAGHPVVATPHLDRLAAGGVRFASHYSQAAPCAPGRAALYTGHVPDDEPCGGERHTPRGPLRQRRPPRPRARLRPALFGYTDQGVDPATVGDAADPRLDTYEGVLPGFDPVLELDGRLTGWLARLEELGYGTLDPDRALRTEPDRPAEHSVSAFLTDSLLAWIDRQDDPWFAHASYWRPHPPYAAAGRWASRYDPADVGVPLAPDPGSTRWCDVARSIELCRRPTTRRRWPGCGPSTSAWSPRSTTRWGGCSTTSEATGRAGDTLVVVTADHGEQLGDHGLVEKLGFYESSYAIPCLVRAPGSGRRPGAGGGARHRGRRPAPDPGRAARPGGADPVRRPRRSSRSSTAPPPTGGGRRRTGSTTGGTW